MARVARPGAIVAGLNEGTRGVLRSPENPEQEAEKALGINEHVHTVWAYVAAFLRGRLAIRLIERADGAPPSPYGRRLSKLPAPGPSLGTLAHLSAYPYARRLDLREEAMSTYAALVEYRELFANLFRRDLQAKYRGSALGVLWTVANPVLLMGVYYLVFGVVWNSPFANGDNYRALPAHRARGVDVLRGGAPVVDPLDARQREPDPQDALPAPARAALGRRRAPRQLRRHARRPARRERDRAAAGARDRAARDPARGAPRRARLRGSRSRRRR